MKIIYEPGDIVEVEDNSEAGGGSACTVELISKQGTMWKVKICGSYCGNVGIIADVDERYLHPQ